MFATGESDLCPHHARLEVLKRRRDQAVSRALLQGIDTFTTPDSLTLFLSNLLRELVNKRVDRRDAATMAYISQLLLAGQAAFQRFAEADLDADNPAAFLRLIRSQADSAVAKAASEQDQN